MPAMAATQDRLRRSSRSRSPRPRSNHSSARTHSKATRSATGRGGPDRSAGQPTARGVGGRQVDPAVGPVLEHVAQDVGELQGHPEVVGQGYGPDRVGASRRRRARAGRPSRPPAGSSRPGRRRSRRSVPCHVHLAAVDQLTEGPQRGGGSGGRRRPRPRAPGRCVGPDRSVELLAHGRARSTWRRAADEVAVADVVDPPGERVDGGEGLALGWPQEPDAVGEVLGLAPGDGLALGVGASEGSRRPPPDPAGAHGQPAGGEQSAPEPAGKLVPSTS